MINEFEVEIYDNATVLISYELDENGEIESYWYTSPDQFMIEQCVSGDFDDFVYKQILEDIEASKISDAEEQGYWQRANEMMFGRWHTKHQC